jgi:hypothetical protein
MADTCEHVHRPEGSARTYMCGREPGHEGLHADRNTFMWQSPDVAALCDAIVDCGETDCDEGRHSCSKLRSHAGDHTDREFIWKHETAPDRCGATMRPGAPDCALLPDHDGQHCDDTGTRWVHRTDKLDPSNYPEPDDIDCPNCGPGEGCERCSPHCPVKRDGLRCLRGADHFGNHYTGHGVPFTQPVKVTPVLVTDAFRERITDLRKRVDILSTRTVEAEEELDIAQQALTSLTAELLIWETYARENNIPVDTE